jgi:hypothetical protein
LSPSCHCAAVKALYHRGHQGHSGLFCGKPSPGSGYRPNQPAVSNCAKSLRDKADSFAAAISRKPAPAPARNGYPRLFRLAATVKTRANPSGRIRACPSSALTWKYLLYQSRTGFRSWSSRACLLGGFPKIGGTSWCIFEHFGGIRGIKMPAALPR